MDEAPLTTKELGQLRRLENGEASLPTDIGARFDDRGLTSRRDDGQRELTVNGRQVLEEIKHCGPIRGDYWGYRYVATWAREEERDEWTAQVFLGDELKLKRTKPFPDTTTPIWELIDEFIRFEIRENLPCLDGSV